MVTQATIFEKGGVGRPPSPPPPPSPTTAAQRVSAEYRNSARRRAVGFSDTILGGRPNQPPSSILGG